ncbi:hypothetical protein FGB62_7g220 [Gracilaria domingensis]|nr:hypothetical protein FGB62_7g220 [Gracilaria domingensis]
MLVKATFDRRVQTKSCIAVLEKPPSSVKELVQPALAATRTDLRIVELRLVRTGLEARGITRERNTSYRTLYHRCLATSELGDLMQDSKLVTTDQASFGKRGSCALLSAEMLAIELTA